MKEDIIEMKEDIIEVLEQFSYGNYSINQAANELIEVTEIQKLKEENKKLLEALKDANRKKQ